ncbi:MAG TPA: hydrogenase [Planctomycetota bacterium]|nr:hydrogenase [Planctomycetota bacterium]
MTAAEKALLRSLWLYPADVGSCGGCAPALLELLAPRLDIERLGLAVVDSPRHADALLVTGVCTRQSAPRLQELCRAVPAPRVVLAVGACAVSQGVFAGGYNAPRTVEEVVRAADPEAIVVHVPGCPPRPEAILLGISRAMEALAAARPGPRAGRAAP